MKGRGRRFQAGLIARGKKKGEASTKPISRHSAYGIPGGEGRRMGEDLNSVEGSQGYAEGREEEVSSQRQQESSPGHRVSHFPKYQKLV